MPDQKASDLIKLYIKSCAFGFLLAAVFVGLIIWFDVAGVGRLIMESDIGLMATVVFWVLNGIVFAGVQFSIAVMGLADDDDDDPRGGLKMPVFLAELVPVRTSDRKDHQKQ